MSKENTLMTVLNPLEPQVTCIKLICFRDAVQTINGKVGIGPYLFSLWSGTLQTHPVPLVFDPKCFLLATQGEIPLYFTKIKEWSLISILNILSYLKIQQSLTNCRVVFLENTMVDKTDFTRNLGLELWPRLTPIQA